MRHLFWHIAAMQEWEWIYRGQWDLLHLHGLYDAADLITVGVVNYNPSTRLMPELLRDPKVVICPHPDRQQFEYWTLGLLKQWCDQAPDNHQVWYFHTKGATTSTNPHEPPNGCFYWKAYMEEFSLVRWRRAAEALRDFDVCGVEWRQEPSGHFSGNFWEANSHYIRRLPPMGEWQAAHPMDRVYAELWIGQARPTVKCLASFGRDLYRFCVTPDMYPP